MPVTEGLGFKYNLVAAAGGVWINLRDIGAVDFLCVLAAGDTYTLQEAKDSAGTGAQNLAIIKQFYAAPVGGATAWSKVTQAAGASITTTVTTQAAAVFAVNGNSLDDGYHYVKVTATGAGVVTAIAHDLYPQRTPGNLAPLAV